MVQKVTDPSQIVTDPGLLKHLEGQGIDWEYVEFNGDYCPEHPYSKHYHDRKSGKQFAVFQGLPKCRPDGVRICGSSPNLTTVGWRQTSGVYHAKPNIFTAANVVGDTRVTFEHDGKELSWKPQLFLDDVEQSCGEATLLGIDPTNPNYSQNVLEWDYGICKRRLRVIEGALLGKWVFSENPNGKVRIKYNQQGELKLHLGEYAISDDEELIPAEAFIIPSDDVTRKYPLVFGDSLTAYSEADTDIRSYAPTTNYGTESFMTVGDGSSIATARRPLFKMDLSSIAGTTVSAVTASLYEYDAAKSGGGVTPWAVEFNRLLRNWVETEVTWNIYSTGNNWGTAGAEGAADIDSDISATATLDETAEGDYVDWTGATLLEDVQKIASGEYTNYGWRVAAPTAEYQDGENSYNKFYTREQGTGFQPKLVITFTSGITTKTSSDTGQGAETLLSRAYILPEVGTGSESLGSRLLGVAEEGGGTETLLARLLASTETASGLDFGGLFFVSSDVGSGLDAILALEAILTGADSGSGIDTAYLIKVLLSADSGLGTDVVVTLLAGIAAGELMVGSDRLVVKVESAPKGGGMKLPPGGKTLISSRRVNL